MATRAAAGAFLAAVVVAPQVRLAWSTYLRAGPGETYAALDELEHDTPVTVAGCAGRWCRVSSDALEGYVDRDALDLPRLPAPAQPGADCATVGQGDGRSPVATRFCSGAPPRP